MELDHKEEFNSINALNNNISNNYTSNLVYILIKIIEDFINNENNNKLETCTEENVKIFQNNYNLINDFLYHNDNISLFLKNKLSSVKSYLEIFTKKKINYNIKNIQEYNLYTHNNIDKIFETKIGNCDYCFMCKKNLLCFPCHKFCYMCIFNLFTESDVNKTINN